VGQNLSPGKNGCGLAIPYDSCRVDLPKDSYGGALFFKQSLPVIQAVDSLRACRFFLWLNFLLLGTFSLQPAAKMLNCKQYSFIIIALCPITKLNRKMSKQKKKF
jgi:hypothetical protein